MGRGLTIGREFLMVTSTKQKLNIRSSTKAELVRVNNIMPLIC